MLQFITAKNRLFLSICLPCTVLLFLTYQPHKLFHCSRVFPFCCFSEATNIVSVFGLEDHIYDGGGTSLNNKYYYSLAGHLIGVLNNNGTNFLFTDALGSVVSTISNSANSASVGGNQVYGPFGNNPYSKGTMGTTKGYTGQYNDSLTQLDYYGARYYDPLVGVFLSADEVQGNPQGVNVIGLPPLHFLDTAILFSPPVQFLRYTIPL